MGRRPGEYVQIKVGQPFEGLPLKGGGTSTECNKRLWELVFLGGSRPPDPPDLAPPAPVGVERPPAAPPFLETPIGAGGARSRGSGGWEPPRKANFPKSLLTSVLVTPL